MTREEAKKAAEVMLAYAEGKEIELYNFCNWVDTTSPSFNWENVANTYRVKPEPTYRPFANAEECWQEMQKHQPFGWVAFRGNKEYIVRVIEAVIKVNDTLYDFAEAKLKFHFADGAPFGIKVEE